jgi:hypothetical protein
MIQTLIPTRKFNIKYVIMNGLRGQWFSIVLQQLHCSALYELKTLMINLLKNERREFFSTGFKVCT